MLRLIAQNGPFSLYATDNPDPNGGGACHAYKVVVTETGEEVFSCHFQQGPLKQVGPNGTPDVLVAEVLKDRLVHFQNGPFASPYNGWGLSGIQTYLDGQNARTADREKRGVEGVNKA